MILWS